MKMFNRFWYLIFTIVFLSASHCVYCDSSPTVALSLGKIRGENVKTNSGVNYYSFRGIPFAEPPVGELRFAVKFQKFSSYQIDLIDIIMSVFR